MKLIVQNAVVIALSTTSNAHQLLRKAAVNIVYDILEDGCVSTISSDVRRNPKNKCKSNSVCNGGPCRLIKDQFLDCDEGNHFEGMGWPALCAGTAFDDIKKDNDSEKIIIISDSTTESSVSESSSSESSSSESTSSDSDIMDDDSNTNVIVRSDCVETTSNNYKAARDNESSKCKTSDECNNGLCRLAKGKSTAWLFCDEGNNFDEFGWLPVCDEAKIPVRQPVAPSTLSGLCFPGTARVMVQDKGDIPISRLQLGDSVLVDMNGKYEPVYTFGHFQPNAPSAPFVKIATKNGSQITLSFDHMIKTVSSGTIPAALVKKGDSIFHASGKIEIVESTESIQLEQGMYAPFTASGYLIVDNVLVSNYVALQRTPYLQIAGNEIVTHQWIAHAFNAPHRMYCRFVTSCKSESYNAEGISYFVATPLAISKWILKQNAFVMGVCSVVIVTSCGFFILVERYPLLLLLLNASFILFLRKRRALK